MVQIRATCIAFSILFLSVCVCLWGGGLYNLQKKDLEDRLELLTFTLLRGSFVLANAVMFCDSKCWRGSHPSGFPTRCPSGWNFPCFVSAQR